MKFEVLAERILAGHELSIARGLTLIENNRPEGEALLRLLFASGGKALVVGVTGPPGSGKSTMVDRLAGIWSQRGLSTAVIAVDPSSPFTGGAILGDRIRMRQAAVIPGVFIRSMGARGSLGGLAARTAEAVNLLDAAGYDRIIIETVGVGQSEVEVATVAGIVVVVHVPGLGDDIQTIKAGLMEIGDLHVVNKSDLPGADRVKSQMVAMLGMDEKRPIPPVISVVAATGEGLDEVVLKIEELYRGDEQESRRKAWSRRQLELALANRLHGWLERLPQEMLQDGQRQIQERTACPGEVAERLLEYLLASGTK
jgi:LAO/AO transport system kinase